MAKPPSDRFDTIPADLHRTGAHRGPRLKGRGWIAFAWAALATGIIVAGGVITLAVINDSIKFDDILGGTTASTPTPTPTPTPEITPVLDPAVTVTVLNGTETVGLAASVGDSMREAGWAGIGSTANASATDFKTTTVYYVDPAHEAAALGLADSLFAKATADASANGVTLSITSIRVEQSNQFQGAQLTVVLGADFLEPSADGSTDEPVK
ncbi:LytR C-terminal domain-containing protein [Agreia pratensis]|uniref:LytR C-terminal domain-containing protein n=1 Tax=Agreia pratensis TaxID=150121 RepID=UPI00188AB2AD|nr:LytR C-terminal domain-containing protein [Agreia pratensis]MBF4635551.1 LytR C-terminal domain-containing protein [Agreia pratensis]